MESGSVEIRKAIESSVPPTFGEKRAAYFQRVGARLKINASRVKTIFYDTRCRLSQAERTRLLVISDHLQKVSLAHLKLTEQQDEIHNDAIRTLRKLCQDILERTEKTVAGRN